jgi:hypothetical protein
MLSGPCSIIAPSSHTTFSQTQTDATVPLKCTLYRVRRVVSGDFPRIGEYLGRVKKSAKIV